MNDLPPAVASAIREAFGDAPVSAVAPIGGGRSGASLYGFVVEGAPYVVRYRTRARPPGDSAARELACTKIAAEAGVAPRLVHVDPANEIVIMERSSGTMFRRGREAGIVRLARAVRDLHEAPPFPAGPPLPSLFHMLDGALAAANAAPLPAFIHATVGEIHAIAARGARQVSCHNDLNPSNILDDGVRVVLVDWESAAFGDPFFDIGTLGVFGLSTDETRAAFLADYLGRAPDEEEGARSVLGRVLALAYYAAAFTFVASLASRRVVHGEAPTLEDVLARMMTAPAPPDVIAASLAREMEDEASSAACAAAKSRLR